MKLNKSQKATRIIPLEKEYKVADSTATPRENSEIKYVFQEGEIVSVEPGVVLFPGSLKYIYSPSQSQSDFKVSPGQVGAVYIGLTSSSLVRVSFFHTDGKSYLVDMPSSLITPLVKFNTLQYVMMNDLV